MALSNPTPGVPESVWSRVASFPDRLLILDYDGTLAPFQVDRMTARPYPGVTEAVQAIMLSGLRVAIITGRLGTEVQRLLGVEPAPEIWGCHGWEFLHPMRGSTRIPLSDKQLEAFARATYLIKNEGWEGRLEQKYGSLALHTRGASDDEAMAIRRAGKRAFDFNSIYGVILKEFDGGLELRAVGRDKGSAALDSIKMSHPGVFVAYLGDDLTDEDAFGVVKQAAGLTVLSRLESRPTIADYWIRPPDELLDFLTRWRNPIRPQPPVSEEESNAESP